MTVSLRRLAGLTRRARKRRVLQRSPMGTSMGAFVSAIGSPSVKSSRGMGRNLSLVHEAEHDGCRHDEVPGDEEHREGGRSGVHSALAALVALAEGLRRA